MLAILIKVSITAALISYLIFTGKLDFQKLRVFLEDPTLIVAGVLIWVVTPVVGRFFRWWLLLRAAGYQHSMKRAFHLHLVGIFFNSTIPGTVGGDIVKWTYLVTDDSPISKSGAFLSVVLDRVIGSFGLFVLALMMIIPYYQIVLENPLYQKMMIMVFAFVLTGAVFFALVHVNYKGNDPVLRFLSRKWFGFATLKDVYQSFRMYKDKPSALYGALLISIVTHYILFFLFVLLARAIVGPDASWSALTLIYPVGNIAMGVPVAPGGVGVGHVAFEKLFGMAGMNHGADTFNAFFLSINVMNLTCAIPYLFYRKNIAGKIPEKTPGEKQTAVVGG